MVSEVYIPLVVEGDVVAVIEHDECPTMKQTGLGVAAAVGLDWPCSAEASVAALGSWTANIHL